jgi:hypothetical protein
MRNEPNLGKSQMFITVISTTNYNEKLKMDTWSKRTQTKPKQTQSNPILGSRAVFRAVTGKKFYENM